MRLFLLGEESLKGEKREMKRDLKMIYIYYYTLLYTDT